MNHIAAYYKLEKLPNPIKDKWGIRSKARVDCTRHFNSLDDNPFSRFVSGKGQLYFFINTPSNYVKANTRRTSE